MSLRISPSSQLRFSQLRSLLLVSSGLLLGTPLGCAAAGDDEGGGSGGAVTTGGSSAAGGASSGGASTGGAASGGASTGGAASGGASSGGASTGGAASGGASTGGADVGDTGGSPSGGGDDGGTGGDGTGGMTAGFQPCPATGTCNILPLGDSITEDVTSPGGAWRIEFFSRAIADGKDLTFVGSRSNGPDTVAGQPFPKSHEGTSGITIGNLNSKTNMVGLGDAHIILLHIGTNDMYQDAAGAPAALRNYVEDLIEQAPDALLVVSSIIPFSNVEAYNATVEPLVDEKAAEGAHIIFADQYSAFPDNSLADGVHPNPAGYAVMGGVYYDLVEEYLP